MYEPIAFAVEYKTTNKSMKVGDYVRTKTEAVYEPTQESLNNEEGMILEIINDDEIHVNLFTYGASIIFSKDELILI